MNSDDHILLLNYHNRPGTEPSRGTLLVNFGVKVRGIIHTRKPLVTLAAKVNCGGRLFTLKKFRV